MSAPQVAPAPSLVLQLRSATRLAHEALDRALPLGQPDVCLDDWAALCVGLSRVAPPLEERHMAIPELASVLPGLRARRRAHLLGVDLEAMMVSPPTPAPGLLPAITDLPTAIGAAYVVEGSRLGGQVLVRRLTPILGKPFEAACRYHSAVLGRGQWPRMLKAFDDAGACWGPIEIQRCLETATGVFQAFHQSLELALRERPYIKSEDLR